MEGVFHVLDLPQPEMPGLGTIRSEMPLTPLLHQHEAFGEWPVALGELQHGLPLDWELGELPVEAWELLKWMAGSGWDFAPNGRTEEQWWSRINFLSQDHTQGEGAARTFFLPSIHPPEPFLRHLPFELQPNSEHAFLTFPWPMIRV